MTGYIQLVPLLMLAPVLVAVGYFDLRYLRIPNLLSLIGLGIFALSFPLLGWSEVGTRLGVAAAVLLVGTLAFAARLFGGGDVKILSVLMLFIPSGSLMLYSWGFSAALILGILLVLVLRRTPVVRHSSWEGIRSHGKFPMGISIALSGLFHPVAIQLIS
jgi:prepilin peptidase CpaA